MLRMIHWLTWYEFLAKKNGGISASKTTLFRRRNNVENMVIMKVVSTSFVDVLPTSNNDVVSTSYIDVKTTLHMKVVSTSFVNVLPTSSNEDI